MMIMGDPSLNAVVDVSGGHFECVKLDDNGVRKLLLRFQKNGIQVEVKLVPAQVADFERELQEVIEWLGGSGAPTTTKPLFRRLQRKD